MIKYGISECKETTADKAPDTDLHRALRQEQIPLSQRDAYKLMLKEYPDVMDIVQMCQILDVSTKTGYRLIREGKICCIKVGRAYRIPKAHLFTYLCIGC